MPSFVCVLNRGGGLGTVNKEAVLTLEPGRLRLLLLLLDVAGNLLVEDVWEES